MMRMNGHLRERDTSGLDSAVCLFRLYHQLCRSIRLIEPQRTIPRCKLSVSRRGMCGDDNVTVRTDPRHGDLAGVGERRAVGRCVGCENIEPATANHAAFADTGQ